MNFEPGDHPGMLCDSKHYSLKYLTFVHVYGQWFVYSLLIVLGFSLTTAVGRYKQVSLTIMPVPAFVMLCIYCNAYFLDASDNYFQSDLISGRSPNNILLVIVDDMNTMAQSKLYDVLTPNLNTLSKSSITFDNAYAHVPKCGPSRSSFLLNKSVLQSHLRDDCSCKSWKYYTGSSIPLPLRLNRYGYETVGAGKISHQKFGNHRHEGWDKYYPSLDLAWYDEIDAAFITNESCLPECLPLTVQNEEEEDGDGYSTQLTDTYSTFKYGNWKFNSSLPDELLVDWSTDYIRKLQQRQEVNGKPFFFTIGLKKPHLPLFLHEKDVELTRELTRNMSLDFYFDGDLNDVGSIGRSKSNHFYWELQDNGIRDESVLYYMAGKTYTDRNIGSLMDSLKVSELWNSTTVIVVSDNGFLLGQKGHFKKFVLWRESPKVNLIIKPSEAVANVLKNALNCSFPSRVSSAVSLMDIYRTIVNIAEENIFETLQDRRNLLSFCKSEYSNEVDDNYVLSAHNYDVTYYSLSGSEYRYISYEWKEEELYNIQDDPDEITNLAYLTEYSDLKASLKRALWDCLLSGNVHVKLSAISYARTSFFILQSVGRLLLDGLIWTIAVLISIAMLSALAIYRYVKKYRGKSLFESK